jgi:hypothetical protein
MAEKNMETVKKFLLFGFVFAGVLLIGLIWVQGLNDARTSGTVYQPTQTLNDFRVPTKTPTPQSNLLGSDVPAPKHADQTLTPVAPPAEPATPTLTLSPEEIQALMTEEIDQ